MQRLTLEDHESAGTRVRLRSACTTFWQFSIERFLLFEEICNGESLISGKIKFVCAYVRAHVRGREGERRAKIMMLGKIYKYYLLFFVFFGNSSNWRQKFFWIANCLRVPEVIISVMKTTCSSVSQWSKILIIFSCFRDFKMLISALILDLCCAGTPDIFTWFQATSSPSSWSYAR